MSLVTDKMSSERASDVFHESDCSEMEEDDDEEDVDEKPHRISYAIDMVLRQTITPTAINMENSSNVHIGPGLNYNAPITITQYVNVHKTGDNVAEDLQQHAIKAPAYVNGFVTGKNLQHIGDTANSPNRRLLIWGCLVLTLMLLVIVALVLNFIITGSPTVENTTLSPPYEIIPTLKPPPVEKKPPHDRVVVCYVASWARYRTGRGAFTLDDIDPSLCTHLVYAFAGLNINTNSIRSLDEYSDLEENYGLGSFTKITAYKKTFPHLKVTLAIGGWNEGSANYSLMASTPTRRQQFVKSVVTMLKEYNFDGLDLNWEYPGMRDGKPEDKDNFVHLVRELREEFDKHNWILTAALGARKNTIDTAYNVSALGRYLDLMHIICYEYHGPWDKKTGPHAPLYGTFPSDTLSVEFSIKYFLKLGAPRNKLVMGLPLYGRTFFSDGPSNVRSLGVPAEEKGFQGQFTKEDGYMGYNEICIELTNKTTPFEKHWDEKSATPYAIQGNKIIVYDDPRSLTLKVKHAMQNDLAGVMVWSVDTDDFRGDCSAMVEGNDVKYPNYPLLRTINKAVVDTLQDIEKEREREKAKSKDSSGAGLMASTTLCMVSSSFAFMLRK